MKVSSISILQQLNSQTGTFKNSQKTDILVRLICLIDQLVFYHRLKLHPI